MLAGKYDMKLENIFVTTHFISIRDSYTVSVEAEVENDEIIIHIKRD